jgi:hypothetical protein
MSERGAATTLEGVNQAFRCVIEHFLSIVTLVAKFDADLESMKLTRDIQSLSTFKRDTAKLDRQLKKTRQPVVLTVNGKAELVVQDAEIK